jgi:hypothetical protein
LNNILSDPWIYTSDVDYPFWFCWDRIPGTGSPRLVDYLQTKWRLGWAGAARISATADARMIRLADRGGVAVLRVSRDKSDVTLEINGKKVPEQFIPEMHKGELRVYCTWSDMKCVQLVRRTARRWVALESKKDVRAFLDDPDSLCLRTQAPAASSGVGSLFWHLQFLVGKREPLYQTNVNHKDVLPVLTSRRDYDGALARVLPRINALLQPFLSKDTSIVPGGLTDALTTRCPEFRRYELEVYDNDTKEVSTALTYWKGRLHTVHGRLPAQAIAEALRQEGQWEQ